MTYAHTPHTHTHTHTNSRKDPENDTTDAAVLFPFSHNIFPYLLDRLICGKSNKNPVQYSKTL